MFDKGDIRVQCTVERYQYVIMYRLVEYFGIEWVHRGASNRPQWKRKLQGRGMDETSTLRD